MSKPIESILPKAVFEKIARIPNGYYHSNCKVSQSDEDIAICHKYKGFRTVLTLVHNPHLGPECYKVIVEIYSANWNSIKEESSRLRNLGFQEVKSESLHWFREALNI